MLQRVRDKLTVPHSPQQNGRAERFNRTIMEKGTSMLHDAGLSLGFWEQAVMTANYIYNRTPIHSAKWRTLYELWYGTAPDVSHFKVFGCKAYYHVPEHNQCKLDPKSKEAMFVGYEPDTKGYTLWDRHSRSFIISRDVTFDEKTFPSHSDLGNQRPPSFPLPSSSIPAGETYEYPVDVIIPGEPAQPLPAPPQQPQAPQLPEEQPSEEAPESNTQDQRPHTPPNQPPSQPQTEYHTPPTQLTATSPPARRPNTRSSHRPRTINPIPPPAFTPLEPNHNRDIPVEMPAMPDLRRSTRNRHAPVRFRATQDSDDEFMQGSSCLVLVQLLQTAGAPGYRDPLTFKEAMNSEFADEWIEACQYEMDALAHLEVWCLEPLPEGRKAVKSKWVFKKKADGRFCAHLVAKRFTQIEGVDFDETFSPVARFESLQLLLALATLENWEIHQMDIKSVFLYGNLDEEIYMEQPQGFIIAGSEHLVC